MIIVDEVVWDEISLKILQIMVQNETNHGPYIEAIVMDMHIHALAAVNFPEISDLFLRNFCRFPWEAGKFSEESQIQKWRLVSDLVPSEMSTTDPYSGYWTES